MTIQDLLTAVEKYQQSDFRNCECSTCEAMRAIDIPALRRDCQHHAEALRGIAKEIRLQPDGEAMSAADFLAGPQS